MNKIFYECTSLESLPDIKRWNFDKVNNMDYILEGSPINFPLIQAKDKWEKIKEKLYSFFIIVKDFILSAYVNYLPLFIVIIFFILLLPYVCFNLLFLPFKLIYFGLKTDKEEFHFNFQELYDYFTHINGGKEFNSEKNKIAILNIIFVFIMIINSLYLIYEKIYDKLKSKYFLISSLTLNWISLITLIINLHILIELNHSFAIYRQNVNDRFYYAYNNTYDTNNYTDNNSYADTYNKTNYDINETDNADNDVDYETKIISKNEYYNLGDFTFEIMSSSSLMFLCTIFFFL
jgi:surface protein